MQELRLVYYISSFLPLCFVYLEGKGTGEKGSVLMYVMLLDSKCTFVFIIISYRIFCLIWLPLLRESTFPSDPLEALCLNAP